MSRYASSRACRATSSCRTSIPRRALAQTCAGERIRWNGGSLSSPSAGREAGLAVELIEA